MICFPAREANQRRANTLWKNECLSLSLSVRDGIAMSANNSFRVGKQIEIQIDNDSDDM